MDYFNDDESIANEVRDKRCMFKSTMCGMTDIERAFFLHKQREVFLIYNERVSLDHRLHNHAIDYQLKDYKNGLESAKYQILDQTHEYKIERTNSYGIKSIFTVCFNNKTRLTHSPDYVDNILKMHHIDVLAVNCEIHDLLQKNTKLKQALNVVFNSPIDLVNTFISKQFERGTFDGVIVNFAGPFFHVILRHQTCFMKPFIFLLNTGFIS
jgi:hypothetical protein